MLSAAGAAQQVTSTSRYAKTSDPAILKTPEGITVTLIKGQIADIQVRAGALGLPSLRVQNKTHVTEVEVSEYIKLKVLTKLYSFICSLFIYCINSRFTYLLTYLGLLTVFI